MKHVSPWMELLTRMMLFECTHQKVINPALHFQEIIPAKKLLPGVEYVAMIFYYDHTFLKEIRWGETTSKYKRT